MANGAWGLSCSSGWSSVFCFCPIIIPPVLCFPAGLHLCDITMPEHPGPLRRSWALLCLGQSWEGPQKTWLTHTNTRMVNRCGEVTCAQSPVHRPTGNGGVSNTNSVCVLGVVFTLQGPWNSWGRKNSSFARNYNVKSVLITLRPGCFFSPLAVTTWHQTPQIKACDSKATPTA